MFGPESPGMKEGWKNNAWTRCTHNDPKDRRRKTLKADEGKNVDSKFTNWGILFTVRLGYSTMC